MSAISGSEPGRAQGLVGLPVQELVGFVQG